ncbi:MAG: DnaA regulatory inactivator Hda [Nitrosomonas sp.]|nr:DnaA regulatory inactivator Hda [Nitrosomonas sp.]
MKQLLLEVVRVVPPTFENFVACSNEELLRMLTDLINRQVKENFIYLWGEGGCGKSHLLQAVVHASIARQLPVRYIDCGQTAGLGVDSEASHVVVDDVEKLDDARQIRLFDLYNRIRENGDGFFIASGARPPAQLALREDLATRLGWGLVYQVHTLSDTQKIEAMQNHAARRGLALSQGICEYLMKNVQRDLPSLMEIIDHFDQYSLQRQRPVTLALLYQWLRSRRHLQPEQEHPDCVA